MQFFALRVHLLCAIRPIRPKKAIHSQQRTCLCLRTAPHAHDSSAAVLSSFRRAPKVVQRGLINVSAAQAIAPSYIHTREIIFGQAAERRNYSGLRASTVIRLLSAPPVCDVRCVCISRSLACEPERAPRSFVYLMRDVCVCARWRRKRARSP